jgi:hypothetical protein
MVFNSDDLYDYFANPWVQGNPGGVSADGGPLHGMAQSAGITIPAHSVLVFARDHSPLTTAPTGTGSAVDPESRGEGRPPWTPEQRLALTCIAGGQVDHGRSRQHLRVLRTLDRAAAIPASQTLRAPALD